MRFLFVYSIVFFLHQVNGQSVLDSNHTVQLSQITIQTMAAPKDLQRLEPLQGTYLFSGKKNEVVSTSSLDANLTEKTGRQLFAKIPGIFVYDMEGSNQLNIASRGLDPHRGWEFNLRTDGVIMNSDMYGYPASHYSIPMESVEKIELVRGTGSLQYGAQFGGMLNYVTKQNNVDRPIHFETYNTYGSYHLFSTYNAVDGKYKKFRYYAYFSRRSRDGYRQNEHTDYNAQGINFTYTPTENISLRVAWVRSDYTYRIPGPLTDAMFVRDPRQSMRFRNYFNPIIHIPSISCKWELSNQTKLQWMSSAVLGARNSVLFDNPATVRDSINLSTFQYNNRQVDIDHFNSYTNEIRVLHQYRFRKETNTLVAGLQIMNNQLHRTQLGKGTAGSDFDLHLVDPVWGRDLVFNTNNLALYAENSFRIHHDLVLNMGSRLEIGESRVSGKILYYPENAIPVTIQHHFPLFGASFSYKPFPQSELYGGLSTAYRPMIFKDLIPSSIYEKVDPHIKDAKGFNAELGYRGTAKNVKWDFTGFILQYHNRFGTLALTDQNNNLYIYRTNIGNSLTAGIECFIQATWPLTHMSQLTAFTSSAFMDGHYTSGSVKAGNQNKSIIGNKIESVPSWISRNGISYQLKKWSITGLISYTGKTFADALNTFTPNATGAIGLVPDYTLLDLNTTFKFSSNLEVKASINNILNKQYFTKRPLFYPGPGIWPSDGRNASISVITRL